MPEMIAGVGASAEAMISEPLGAGEGAAAAAARELASKSSRSLSGRCSVAGGGGERVFGDHRDVGGSRGGGRLGGVSSFRLGGLGNFRGVVVLALGQLELRPRKFGVVEDVADVEEGGLFFADVDEGGLHAR